jgi:hypothetical protein
LDPIEAKKQFIPLYRDDPNRDQLGGLWVRQGSGQKNDRKSLKKLKFQPGFF